MGAFSEEGTKYTKMWRLQQHDLGANPKKQVHREGGEVDG